MNISATKQRIASVWASGLAEHLKLVLETAILNMRTGEEDAFEAAMLRARPLIAATPGFGGLNLHRCLEVPNRYFLMVKWRALEDHTIGFRESVRYEQWRDLLHHFYEPFPTVEHYGDAIMSGTETS